MGSAPVVVAPQRLLPVLLAVMIGLNPVAIDAYLPALEAMAGDLGIGLQRAENTVALYMIGYAAGLLAAAPFSDRIGRRPLCLVGLLVFLGASLAIAATTSATMLMALRVMHGVGAGICLVNVGAIVRDLYDEHDSARQLARITLLLMALPLIAPIGGAMVLSIASWRWIFVALAVYAALVLLAVLRWLPETGHLRGRAVSTTGPLHFLAGHVRSVLAHRRATFFALTSALSAATLFAFLSDAAFVYLEYFDVPTTQFPWYFGANVVLMAALHVVNLHLLRRHAPRQILAAGIVLLGLSSLWALAYTLLFTPALLVVAANTALVLGMQTLVVNNSMAAYMSRFNENAGMANALSGSLIFVVGALSGLALAALHNGHPSALAATWFIVSVLAAVTARIALREKFSET